MDVDITDQVISATRKGESARLYIAPRALPFAAAFDSLRYCFYGNDIAVAAARYYSTAPDAFAGAGQAGRGRAGPLDWVCSRGRRTWSVFVGFHRRGAEPESSLTA